MLGLRLFELIILNQKVFAYTRDRDVGASMRLWFHVTKIRMKSCIHSFNIHFRLRPKFRRNTKAGRWLSWPEFRRRPLERFADFRIIVLRSDCEGVEERSIIYC